jgi:hypothetical protein
MTVKTLEGKEAIPALGRQRQVGLCEFEASLVYIVSFQYSQTLEGAREGERERARLEASMGQLKLWVWCQS